MSRTLRAAKRLKAFTGPSLAWTVDHMGGDGESAYNELAALIEAGEVVETAARSRAAWGARLIVYRLAVEGGADVD